MIKTLLLLFVCVFIVYPQPSVDSIRAKTQRDFYTNVFRPLDTAFIYGGGFTYGDSTSVFINSTGTVRGVVLGGSADSCAYTVPAGVPTGYYKGVFRNAAEVVSDIPETYNSYCKVPYRP